jgi:uncharacterized Zn-binding protein involved in type VI secretion
MAKLTYQGAMSQASCGLPATPLTTNVCTKSFVAEGAIGVVGSRFTQHQAGRQIHPISIRNISSGASKTFFEGKAAARVGDSISCGDKVKDGSAKTNIE